MMKIEMKGEMSDDGKIEIYKFSEKEENKMDRISLHQVQV